jgi:hypothetical protein
MANLLGGGFLIVAVFAFTITTAVRLGFAVSIPLVLFGLAMAVSALRAASLVIREIVTERVVHLLEVRDREPLPAH